MSLLYLLQNINVDKILVICYNNLKVHLQYKVYHSTLTQSVYFSSAWLVRSASIYLMYFAIVSPKYCRTDKPKQQPAVSRSKFDHFHIYKTQLVQ